jgi:predicted ester cyclase
MGLASQFNNLKVEIKEMMVTNDGSRVITRMLSTGHNNGAFGTEADNAPVSMTVISILAIKDGKIAHNWVEKNALGVYQGLTAEAK